MEGEPTDDDPLAGESARDMLAALAAAPPIALDRWDVGGLSAGTLVGDGLRIEARIGAGGMGVVYRAHDPELDRSVALKLQRSDSERSIEHLREEARAMARVVHPNVVTVHAVGVERGVLYIAMELACGGTLREWLAHTPPRSPAEILAMFLAAGAGLAAAHRAGLVHRDFKPENVLLDAEGRPKVADFGLAHMSTMSMRHAPTGATPASVPAGTLSYMAPEQVLGLEVDASADQFALCVCVYEALTGVRPFPRDPGARLLAIDAGELRPPGAAARVPRAVLEVLRRGLSARPEDRFASVDDLLGALRRAADAPARRRRWLVLGAAVLAAALGVAAWPSAASPCDDADAQLAGIWDSARRREVGDAVRAGPFGEPGWGAMEIAIDAHADAWRRAWPTACHADPGGPATTCLRRSRASLDTIVRSIERTGDGEGGGIDALARLGAPQDCASAVETPPTSPLREEIEAVGMRRMIEPPNALLPECTSLAERARAGGIATEIAGAQLELALVTQGAHGAEAAIEEHRRAAAEALHAGDPALTLRSLSGLLHALTEADRLEEASAYLQLLEASAEHPHAPELAGVIADTSALTLVALGKRDDAIAASERAVEQWLKAVGPEGWGFLRARENLAAVLLEAGRPLDARREYEGILPILRRRMGRLHAVVGKVAASLAMACARMGDHACARSAMEEATEVLDAAPLPVGFARSETVALVAVAQELGDTERGLGLAADLAERCARDLGADHHDTVLARTNLALYLADLGRFPEALAIAVKAHESVRRSGREDDARIPSLATLLAGLHRETGDPERALPLHEAAIAQVERAGDGGGSLVNLRIEYGHSLLAAGRADDAAAQAEAALAAIERFGPRPGAKAEAQFLIARALGAGSARASALAGEAAEVYGTMGPRYADELARVQAWIAKASKHASPKRSPPGKPNVP